MPEIKRKKNSTEGLIGKAEETTYRLDKTKKKNKNEESTTRMLADSKNPTNICRGKKQVLYISYNKKELSNGFKMPTENDILIQNSVSMS